MILIDTNLLIYAVNQNAPLHKEAREWLENTLSSPTTIGLASAVLLAFLRLTTRSGIFNQPLTVEDALAYIQEWLDYETVTLVHPGPRHISIWRDLLIQSGTGGNLTTDAYLAALAIERNAELYSSDHDFARFKGLRWRNPFAFHKKASR